MILFFCNRRKVPTRTKENEPDPYIDLQPRPEADTTYQEMDITSTASSKRPGERRVPSSHLIYENQNAAQYANKRKEGADYETVD